MASTGGRQTGNIFEIFEDLSESDIEIDVSDDLDLDLNPQYVPVGDSSSSDSDKAGPSGLCRPK